MLQSIFGFLIILGPLVVFHEFGHYIFARIFGVKAEIFSIGFGPTLWKKQLGETELRLSVIPLGGYVKLLGEDPEQELPADLRHRALQRQLPWKRFFIFFGGPLFNFILAGLIFMLMMVVGEPHVVSVVGRVLPGTPAEQVGFKSGDRIVSVNGQPVSLFEDVLVAVSQHPDEVVNFHVIRERKKQELDIQIKAQKSEGYTSYGQKTALGEVDGWLPNSRTAQVGVSDPSSLAGRAGVTTGDQVVSINAQPVSSFEILEDLYRELPEGSDVTVVVKKAAPSKSSAGNVEVKFKKTGNQPLEELSGIYSSELFVEKAVDSSPAKSAGIQLGDRLVAISGTPVRSFFELRELVQKNSEAQGKVSVQWERAGKKMEATLTPTATHKRDPELKKQTQFTIGIMPMLVWNDPEVVVQKTLNPFTLIYRGVERTITSSWRNLMMIVKMITGEVSVGTLGGPILIGKIAGESLSKGLIAFLTTMSMLSIGLGVLNLLPVPVLDGGHLVLLGLESIRGKPLTVRQMEILQQVGLSLILLLMVIAFRNDFARIF